MTEQPAHLPVMGLYYPYVHFRDERWLKLAALTGPIWHGSRLLVTQRMTQNS